nr:PREDICTED: high affinity cationic amino acid transporter 1-like [Bemisia tabaci]
MTFMRGVIGTLTRIKVSDEDIVDSDAPKLARVLDLFDLTLLGVGTTLGVGTYVLPGAVAKNTAGPAVTVCFAIAAVVSILAALCYAEFAARVPKAGSAYVYCYVTVGEFCAFIIGWNLLLEFVIGTASVAKAFTGYVDALFGGGYASMMQSVMPMHVSFLAQYPDLMALCVVLLFSLLLAWGVKESTFINNIFTTVNLVTVVIVIFAGIYVSKMSNWFIDPAMIPPEHKAAAGKGGFMPYGWSGVLAGAATCFYSFGGFDSICTTGEEAKNPQRTIPLAIVMTLAIVFVAYFGVSSVITMAWPYYDQHIDAPFPYVFDKTGLHAIKWIVTVGALFALCTSMLGVAFPLPRILYAMSSDGLIYKFFSRINAYTQTPVLATLISGLLAGIMAAMFDLTQLIDMMSIGTLMAYSIVALCVILLRYKEDESSVDDVSKKQNDFGSNKTEQYTFSSVLSILSTEKESSPTARTVFIARISTTIFCAVTIIQTLILVLSESIFSAESFWSVLSTLVVLANFVILGATMYVISLQPQSDTTYLKFRVPGVPVVPCCCIFMNTYLMAQLDFHTWVRFAVWLAVGFVIYFTYGIQHSVQGILDRQQAKQELKSQPPPPAQMYK